ncbi:YlxR family protein [Carboxydochorda subterranea]|uniref:YlxR family protein n=1 Tax=Carboxydichorda subterranea TaxID=3109565 RepID=A0ABZ1C0X2_9FIRM|nr:YlxR family protein [Limnochorda sp. L945t]WRP18480.1 YlxR family protein [Limnochorda sp. L945t]
MSARQQPRPRKVPMRTCVGCRTVRPKREMIRIVRTPEGSVVVDPTGKRSGRGAYICPRPECLEAARRGRQLERALEHPIEDEVFDELARQLAAAGGAR